MKQVIYLLIALAIWTTVAVIGISILGCNESMVNRLDHLNHEVDTVQDQVHTLATAAAEVPDGSTDTETALAKLRAANAVSAPFNPYSGVIDAGLLLAGLLVGGGSGVAIARKTAKTKE